MKKKQTDLQMIREIGRLVQNGKERMIKKIVSKLRKMTPNQVQKWNEIMK